MKLIVIQIYGRRNLFVLFVAERLSREVGKAATIQILDLEMLLLVGSGVWLDLISNANEKGQKF